MPTNYSQALNTLVSDNLCKLLHPKFPIPQVEHLDKMGLVELKVHGIPRLIIQRLAEAYEAWGRKFPTLGELVVEKEVMDYGEGMFKVDQMVGMWDVA